LNTKLFVPSEIVVGQQKRSDTYTGRLGYIIYKDEKGVLRKKTSWEGWRDKTIEPGYYENKPTEGFVLNRHGGGDSHSRYSDYYGRAAFIRVYDPRGFEFEITLENMLFILRYADCSRGKGLEGNFVYAWSGKDLVLLPEGCEEYKESMEFTQLKSLKVSTKELIPGYTYLTKDMENLLYLGKYNYLPHSSYSHNEVTPAHVFYRASQTLEDYIEKSGYGDKYWEQQAINYAQNREQYKNYSNYQNYQDYYTQEKLDQSKKDTYKCMEQQYQDQKFVSFTPAKIAKVVDTNMPFNYAEIVSELENSGKVVLLSRIEEKKKPVDIPANQYWSNGRSHGEYFLKISDNHYKRVGLYVVSSGEDNSWRYGRSNTVPTLLGFQMQNLYEFTISDKGIKKKKLKEEKSKTIIPPSAINDLDFLDLIIKFNENKVVEIV